MTNGPTGFSRPNQQLGGSGAPEPELDPLADSDSDPLLGRAGQPPPEPRASEAQRPRGHRQRRTTLPRATRGWSRGIVWSLVGLTVFGTLYGLLARIDSSIEASGKLHPARGVTAVSPPFNSLVSEVLIRENEWVQVGQPLLRVRDDAMRLQRQQLLAIKAGWNKELELLSHQLGLPTGLIRDPVALRQLEVSQLEVRLRSLAAGQERARSVINTEQQVSDLEGLRRKLAINHQITERMSRLQHAGGISRLDLDHQREREIEVEMALSRTEKEVVSGRRREQEGAYKQQQISAANLKQLFTAFDNSRQQLRETESRLLEVEERIKLSTLKAPVAGRVFDLAVKKGEMATPARPALKIVPQGTLEARVAITNRDVGFVRVGMPVEVRVASFPFTDYGSLKGSLVRLGADAQPADAAHPQDYFEATVRLGASSLERDGTSYALRPGMAITALLQMGPRPVISLLSDRLGKFFDSTRSIR